MAAIHQALFLRQHSSTLADRRPSEPTHSFSGPNRQTTSTPTKLFSSHGASCVWSLPSLWRRCLVTSSWEDRTSEPSRSRGFTLVLKQLIDKAILKWIDYKVDKWLILLSRLSSICAKHTWTWTYLAYFIRNFLCHFLDSIYKLIESLKKIIIHCSPISQATRNRPAALSSVIIIIICSAATNDCFCNFKRLFSQSIVWSINWQKIVKRCLQIACFVSLTMS